MQRYYAKGTSFLFADKEIENIKSNGRGSLYTLAGKRIEKRIVENESLGY
jgi:hypothetical protein